MYGKWLYRKKSLTQPYIKGVPMNKMVLTLAAVAALIVADASARCCKREAASCGRPVQTCVEPEAPICKVPCVTYKQVPAIRHVSYSCPTGCLTEQEVDGHNLKIRTMHEGANIQVDVQEA